MTCRSDSSNRMYRIACPLMSYHTVVSCRGHADGSGVQGCTSFPVLCDVSRMHAVARQRFAFLLCSIVYTCMCVCLLDHICIYYLFAFLLPVRHGAPCITEVRLYSSGAITSRCVAAASTVTTRRRGRLCVCVLAMHYRRACSCCVCLY